MTAMSYRHRIVSFLLGLVNLGVAVAVEQPRGLPKPLAGHPGNVFVVGEQVMVALPKGEKQGGTWQLVDYEGHTVANGTNADDKIILGKLPGGYYELKRLGDGQPEKQRVTIGVVATLVAPTPLTSPIGVDVSMAWQYSGTD